MSGTDPKTSAAGPSAAASEAWIRDHLDAVYRYAKKRLSAADAEDVAQQSFAALFRAEAEGRAPDDPGAYLVGVARRRIQDHFRRRGQGFVPVALPGGWEGFCDRPLPDEVAAARETADLVHVALGLLRTDQRDVLGARYREGATVAEIAARFGWGEKAAELRLARARAAFRARYLEVGRDWEEGAP
jgi:RNA polymerase sigma-70 factor (ECF subfamily)